MTRPASDASGSVARVKRGRYVAVRIVGFILLVAAVALAVVPVDAYVAGKPVRCNGVPPFFIGIPSDPGPDGITPKDAACTDAAFSRMGWAMLVGVLAVALMAIAQNRLSKGRTE